jgi:hypothetical protein
VDYGTAEDDVVGEEGDKSIKVAALNCTTEFLHSCGECKLEEIEALIARAEACARSSVADLNAAACAYRTASCSTNPQLMGRPADGATRARAATP